MPSEYLAGFWYGGDSQEALDLMLKDGHCRYTILKTMGQRGPSHTLDIGLVERVAPVSPRLVASRQKHQNPNLFVLLRFGTAIT
jgi:hypothetical protein